MKKVAAFLMNSFCLFAERTFFKFDQVFNPFDQDWTKIRIHGAS